MRYTIDQKREIVDLYIEDDNGREVHQGLDFKEIKGIIEDIIWDMNNPTGP